LAQSACEDLRVLAEMAGITLIVNISQECTVLGDCRALRRLILILLDNAIKYSHRGGEVRLRVRLSAECAHPATIIEVRDHGAGIEPEHLPHIFDRFYRASKDRSRKIDEVGLGLSIAKVIACRHGGDIEVESIPGSGSIFRVLLPAA